MSVKLSLRDPPQRRMIAGRPASCRDCCYVLDRKLKEVTVAGQEAQGVEVVCCLEGPPKSFVWSRSDLEPFCGRFVPASAEGSASARGGAASGDAVQQKAGVVVPGEVVPTFGGRQESSRESAAAASSAVSELSLDLGSVSLSLRRASSD